MAFRFDTPYFLVIAVAYGDPFASNVSGSWADKCIFWLATGVMAYTYLLIGRLIDYRLKRSAQVHLPKHNDPEA